MGSTLSPNMNLPLPNVSQQSGPQYAQDLNDSLTLVDAHDHSSGSGVPITPDGINISSDLPFSNNNGTQFRSVRFTAQSAPIADVTDIGCLYESGVDLYYNDGSGNQVRMTQSGGVAGTPGSIASLVSPASATWVSGSSTFVWQSAASTPANMDFASATFRNLIASSKGLTLNPPALMPSDFTLTLPSLPNSTKLMNLDSAGNMGTISYADTATALGSGGALTLAQLLPRAAALNASSLGIAISTASGAFTTSSGSYVPVTNLATSTLVTNGKTVEVKIVPDHNGSLVSSITTTTSGATSGAIQGKILRNGTLVSEFQIAPAAISGDAVGWPPVIYDTPAAGTYTYSLEVKCIGRVTVIGFNNVQLMAYELS